jgi:apolipoprotein N-acyltransferase
MSPRARSSASPPRPRAGWLAAYVVVTFLCYPHPIGDAVLDLGALAAWLSPACLLLGLRGLSPRRAAVWGFAAALAAHAAILHWLWIVSVVYGHAHPLVGVLGPLGLGAYIALFTAVFASVAGAGPGVGPASPFVLAALWTGLDQLRSFVFTGFPWATLGYAQHLNPALLGLVPYTGVYGLSWVSALGGAALARLVDERGMSRGTAAALAGVGLAHAVGGLLAASTPVDPGETVRVAVLQGNIDQGVKWNRAWYERTLAVYEDLSRRAADAGAELIVWPETAVPGAIGDDPEQTERFAALARETGAALVVGAVGVGAPSGDGVLRLYDSAFLVERGGAVRDRYDKSHLVPFGEYVPFRDLLGRMLEAVARGIADTGVTAGPGPRSVQLDVEGRPLTAGVPICYELLFPDLMRRFVQDGAELLLAITNDAWYGRTGAPYQFLAITALRSAETRVWTARAANTGVSAIIDARGRVQARTRIFEVGWLVADVPRRPPPTGGSFYARHGDVFVWGCWLAVALVSVLALRERH